MKSRSRSVLAKLITLLALPLISLVVLWGIAASASVGPGIDLLRVSDEASDVVTPLQDLGRELRAERLESVIVVASAERSTEPLRRQRVRTDEALSHFRDRAVNDASTDAVRTRIDTFLKTLDDLDQQREAIDRRTISRLAVVDYFTNALDRSQPIVFAIPHLPVSDYALRANATLELATAIELQSQELAVIAGAAIAGKFEGGEYTRAVELIGAQRRFYADATPQLEPVDQDALREVTDGASARVLSAMEDAVIGSGTEDAVPPIDADDWISSSRVLSQEMTDYSIDVANRLFDDFLPTATWVLVRVVVAALLGLVAVIVSIIVSIRIGRSLVRELVGVQRSALSLATYELPAVVRRLRAGESVDVDAEVQPLTGFTIREVEGVARAMDAARSTAVEVAVEEAQLRRGVREVFLNLARRSQALVHRQLTLLDAMERREKDPDELDDLFQLDHLATRMRRHAEDLIVLSGSTPGRGWRNPVPLVDVMRGAVAEVEDYARVRVVGVTRASLAGRAVSDVIHLLAELIENATSFSPPHTTVHVSGELVPAGFAIEIEDRGLGMPAEQLAEVNARLADPPEFDLLNSERLGLFVVGQLARRHDIRVVLRGSPFGGTTAIVLLPASMVVAQEKTLNRTPPVVGPEAQAVDSEATGSAGRDALPGSPPTLSIAPANPAEPVRGDAAVDALAALSGPSGDAAPNTYPPFEPTAWQPVTAAEDDYILRAAEQLRAEAGTASAALDATPDLPAAPEWSSPEWSAADPLSATSSATPEWPASETAVPETTAPEATAREATAREVGSPELTDHGDAEAPDEPAPAAAHRSDEEAAAGSTDPTADSWLPSAPSSAPPLARREPGAGWDHLTSQAPTPLPRRERRRQDSVEPDGEYEPEASPLVGWDSPDTRPRGVAQAPLASRGIPAEPDEPDGFPSPTPAAHLSPAAHPFPAARPFPAAPPEPIALPEPTRPAEPVGQPLGPAGQPLGGPVRTPDPGPAAVTPGGLPRRVRQANLAAPLRAGSGIPQAPVEPTSVRSPEEIRAVMGSYQRGSILGRTDAARTIDTAESPPSPVDGPGQRAHESTSDHAGESWPDGQSRTGEVPAGRGSNTGTREGER